MIPCNSKDGTPLAADEVIAKSTDNADTAKLEDDDKQPIGNDAHYTNKPFQIQIVVTTAMKGVYVNKLQSALYARGKLAIQDDSSATNDEGCIGGISVHELIHTDEELKSFKDKMTSTGDKQDNASGVRFDSNQPEGYYVQVMLLESSVQEEDVVIPPPMELNKVLPKFRPLDSPVDVKCVKEKCCSLYQGVYTSPQFTLEVGPWEKENIQAFQMVALDVQKALVRVEFPEFDEGCKDKTFREVYQLNARVRCSLTYIHIITCHLCLIFRVVYLSSSNLAHSPQYAEEHTVPLVKKLQSSVYFVKTFHPTTTQQSTTKS